MDSTTTILPLHCGTQAALGSLPKLSYLNLHHNELDGHIPPELGNLRALGTLYLSKNRFSGTKPASLGRLDTEYTPGRTYIMQRRMRNQTLLRRNSSYLPLPTL
jgi:Leucine-rich repeat (LRR) protein